LNGIFWVLRTGAPWRALPKEFGPRTICYNRIVRWRKAGVWDRVLAAVTKAYARQRADDRQHLGASASACRQLKKSHPDRCMGRSRGGLTTKIHALTDAHGLPLELVLTPGQAGDCPVAKHLLGWLQPDTIVLADKAYDADWLRRRIEAAGAAPNIPAMVHRRWKPCFSPVLYRARNRIERFFNRIKHFRRLATRYEKHATNFLAMLKLAATHLWLRHNECPTAPH
jgi:transposase